MTGALIIAAVIVVTAVILALLEKKRKPVDEHLPSETEPLAEPDDGQCCGRHQVCLKNSKKWVPGVDETLYYDDEELDQFRGRSSDDYSESEIETFRDIMLTLAPGEAPGWHESLRLRGIVPPDVIAQELDMLVAEQINSDTIPKL